MRGDSILRALGVLGLVACLAMAAGCWSKRPHKDIEAVGVMAAEQPVPANGVYTITFDDGKKLELPGGPSIVEPRGPNAGDLVLGGRDPDNWILVANPRPGFDPVCYGIDSQTGVVRDNAIELDFGVTLPKAADFNPGRVTPNTPEIIPQDVICLNRQGQVTSIG